MWMERRVGVVEAKPFGHTLADHFCLVRRPNEKGHMEHLLDFCTQQLSGPGSGVFSYMLSLTASVYGKADHVMSCLDSQRLPPKRSQWAKSVEVFPVPVGQMRTMFTRNSTTAPGTVL